MPTYVVLTRLTPEAVKTPGELKRLEKVVADHVRRDCPQAKWVANYAILGPYDYMDIFEAPDETIAAKVVMIIRSYGHAQTETWTAMPWERFEIVLPSGAEFHGKEASSGGHRRSARGRPLDRGRAGRMYKHILIPTDASALSEMAIRPSRTPSGT